MDVSTQGNWEKNTSISVNGQALYQYIILGKNDLTRSTREFMKNILDQLKDIVVFAGIRSRTFKYGDGQQEEGIGEVRGMMMIGTLRVVSTVD